MNILINNQLETIPLGMTIESLLVTKDVKNKYFAVEVNEQIIPKSNHSSYVIQDGDKIEIVIAIGGG